MVQKIISLLLVLLAVGCNYGPELTLPIRIAYDASFDGFSEMPEVATAIQKWNVVSQRLAGIDVFIDEGVFVQNETGQNKAGRTEINRLTGGEEFCSVIVNADGTEGTKCRTGLNLGLGDIDLYVDMIARFYPEPNYAHAVSAITIHELGHSLWLADLDPGVDSLMTGLNTTGEITAIDEANLCKVIECY